MRRVILAFSLFFLFGMALPRFELKAQKTETRGVDGLIYELKHPEPAKRREAARILGENRVRSAVPALIELTQDPDEGVRLEAVRALVQIRDNRALESYVRLTQDPVRDIQKKAIEGIINVYVVEENGFVQGVKKFVNFVNPFSDDYNPLVVEPYVPVSEEAIGKLAGLLTHSNSGIRKDAATALGILRARSALPAIEEGLQREGDDGVKVELIRAIYKIGDPASGEAVIPLIRDRSKRVHDEAIFTAGRLRVRRAVPQLMEMYSSGIAEARKLLGVVPVSGSDDLQRKLLEALAYIGDPASLDVFLPALEDPREFYRRYGAEGIGRAEAREQTTLVARHYLVEPAASVKLAMSYTLFRLGREEHLIELVRQINNGDQAYFYLLELEPEQVDLLYPYVRTEDPPRRARLLDVIGQRGGPTALALAEEMSRDTNADVASAANLAIRRLHGRFPGS